MAAHSYRAWLFEHEGLTVWNAQWYGGHHVLGYSLLFAPLAAAFGPAFVGVLLRGRRRRAVRPARARGGAVAGRGRGRRRGCSRPACCPTWRSGGCRSCSGSRWRSARGRPRAPQRRVLSGVLGAGGDARQPGRGRVPDARRGREADRRRAPGAARPRRGSALPTLAGGIALYLLFPEGGTDRFAATAFWPMLVISAAGVALLAPGRRTLWAGGLLYLGVLIGAFVVPSPFGQNALRLGVLAGPSVLALAHRKRVPVLALAVVGVGLLYLQWLPAVRAVAEAHGDPSTRLAFQAEARDFLAAHGQARRARRGAADHEPLGGGRPGQGRPARARVGAPARPEGEPDLLRRRAADRVDATTTGCARTPSAGSRCRTRRSTTPRARRRSCSSAGRSSSSSSTSRRAGGSGRCAAPIRPPPTARSCSPPGRTGSWSTRRSRPSSATATRRTGRPTNACVSRAPGGWTRVEPRGAGRRAGPGAFGLERGRRAKAC